MTTRPNDTMVDTLPVRPGDGHLTLSQLSKEIGLSFRTVSSVLNNLAEERGISATTAARVRDYAAKRGYVPARHAMRMHAKNTGGGFGVLLNCRLRYSHLYEAFNLFSDKAADDPKSVEIVFCQGDRIEAGLTELAARRIERFIWICQHEPMAFTSDADAVRALLPRFSRVALYNYPFPRPAPGFDDDGAWDGANVVRVGVNRSESYQALARYLHGLGHRRVALMSAKRGETGTWLHEAMAREGLEGVGARPPELSASASRPMQVPALGPSLAEGALWAIREQGATAICFGDDLEAATALAPLATAGVRVPEDVTVAGFNGHALSAMLAPPLTTLAMPVERLVERTFEALAAQDPAPECSLPMDLLVRASSGPPPAKG